jgi:hypothetical protein
MNQVLKAQKLFLQTVRAQHPALYQRAIARVVAPSGLGGLGDDLTQDIDIGDPTASIGISDDVTNSVNNAVDSSSTDDSTASVISALASAAATIAPAVVTTQAQLATIQLNAQRAAAGLAPLGSSASLLTGAGLTGSTGLILLLAVGAGVLLLGRKSSSPAS